jgi:hypothetical protein
MKNGDDLIVKKGIQQGEVEAGQGGSFPGFAFTTLQVLNYHTVRTLTQ